MKKLFTFIFSLTLLFGLLYTFGFTGLLEAIVVIIIIGILATSIFG